ncbi:MAG: hypothetical protein ACYSWU_13750 [Planctomycetota bacterium]|jgi:hypothetical protein
MKALSTSLAVVFATCAGIAQAQTWCPTPILVYRGPQYASTCPYYVPYCWRWGTPAESWARARATLIHAQANSAVLWSIARNNSAEACRREIENDQSQAETFFRKRQIRDEFLRAERERRHARRERLLQAIANKPPRTDADLLDVPAGKVLWPTVLKKEELTACRSVVESFLLRPAAIGGGAATNREKVAEAAQVLLAELQGGVRRTPGNEYIAAKRLLERVASDVRNQAG